MENSVIWYQYYLFIFIILDIFRSNTVHKIIEYISVMHEIWLTWPNVFHVKAIFCIWFDMAYYQLQCDWTFQLRHLLQTLL